MDRNPTSTGSPPSLSVDESKLASRHGVQLTIAVSNPSPFSQHRAGTEAGHSNAAELLSATVQATGSISNPRVHTTQSCPLTSSSAVTAEAGNTAGSNNDSSSSPAAALLGNVPVARSGMYPTSRRRMTPVTPYSTASSGVGRAPGVDASAAASVATVRRANFFADEGSNPAQSPLHAGASTGSSGLGSSFHSSYVSLASPLSGTQRAQQQQRRAQTHQQSTAAGDAVSQQYQRCPPASHSGDNESGAYSYECATENMQQQPYNAASNAHGSSSGGVDQAYAAYSSAQEYAQGEADSTEVDAVNASTCYQQYYSQYYQHQMHSHRPRHLQQQQQAAAVAPSDCNRDDGLPYRYVPAAGAGGEGPSKGGPGGVGGAGGGGGGPPQVVNCSTSVNPSHGGNYGQHGGHRGGYNYEANENTNTGAASYAAQGASGAVRGSAAQHPAAGNTIVDGLLMGTANAANEAAGGKYNRTGSRTDSATSSANASSTDVMAGYAGVSGPQSAPSSSYPSQRYPQSAYANEYASSAAQQQYCSSYGTNQAMTGGYGDYYNSCGSYGYNAGYCVGALQQQQQQQQQQHQQQRQQLPYQRGGSRGVYSQPSYASHGYGIPYQGQYRGNALAGGNPENLRQEQQEREVYVHAESSPQSSTYRSLNVARPPSITHQYVDDVRERYSRDATKFEEPSTVTHLQSPQSASLCSGKSKGVIRKRKTAAAAAETSEETAGASADPPFTAAQPFAMVPSKLAGKEESVAAEGSTGAAASEMLEGVWRARAAPAVEGASSKRNSMQHEKLPSTNDSLMRLLWAAPAEKRTSQLQPPYEKRNATGKESSALVKVAGKSSGKDEATSGIAFRTSDETPLANGLPADTSTLTSSSSNTFLEASGSINGDLIRTSSGAHGRSSSHVHGASSSSSPGAKQRFLRHSPLAQCIGVPFHAYLNGAIAGQAAHMQALPLSAASAAAAVAGSDIGACHSTGASGAHGAAAGVASSNASFSTCSSHAIQSIYTPAQRMLTQRTASSSMELFPEGAPQHSGSQHGDTDADVDADEGSEDGPDDRRTGRASQEDGSKINYREGGKGVSDDRAPVAGGSSARRQQLQHEAQLGEATTLPTDLRSPAGEPSCGRPSMSSRQGAVTTPSSSTHSFTAIRPHHMHLFVHHSQSRRSESPQASALLQHRHAYRHASPSSLQPAALSAAVASTTSDPYLQSPASSTSLPLRSPASAGAAAGAMPSPSLRGRGAGAAIKPNAFHHVTSTNSAPNLPMAGVGGGSGAASTMQQQQQCHASPYPSSLHTYSPSGGGGYSEASGADATDVYSTDYDDVGPHSGGGSDEQRREPVSSSFPRSQQHQQQQHVGAGGGSSGSWRGGVGGYHPTSSPSVGPGASTALPMSVPVAGKPGHCMPPAVGTLTPNAESQLLTQQGPSGMGSGAGAAGHNTPSPRGSRHGNNSGGNGGGGSVHASNSNITAAQPNSGFPVLPQHPAYLYENYTAQEVRLVEYHSSMCFNAPSFGNIACLVDALSPQVPIVSDLEFPCDEEQCQLLQPSGLAGGAGMGTEEAGLLSPGAVPRQGSSHRSGCGSHGDAVPLPAEDPAPPALANALPRPAEADRSRYWDFEGPSYCEPVITLKSIWQSFDNPFGCVVHLADPIYPAPMRPAEDELVYTPLLSGFRIRFHPASPAYKRLAAIREVRRQRRREESGATGGADGGTDNTASSGGNDDSTAGSYAEEDGVLTWSAADRPNNRNIILEQITELARCDESYAVLLTATSADVDHQSWVALMWQPVFCGGHSAKHSCGTFLAFYLLRAPRHLFVPFANKSDGAAMNSSWSSPVFRGDRAALSFDLWSLQRQYHVARWVSPLPITHITATLSAVREEDDATSSVSASRGRLSWEEGPVGCASNTTESHSLSNNGDSRVRQRDLMGRGIVEGGGGVGAAPTCVRVPLVGLIPNRCRSEVWFKAIYDTNAPINMHRNASNGASGGGNNAGETVYHAPLFLMVTALQLMCWDAYKEWHGSSTAPPSAFENREAEPASGPEDVPTTVAVSSNEQLNEPNHKIDPRAGGDSVSGVTQLMNPLTQLMEEEISAVSQRQPQRQRGSETERGNGLSNATASGQDAEAGTADGSRPSPALRNGSTPWVSYFMEGVEIMTDAARRYRAVRETANLDAAVEESGGAGAAALQANPTTAATPLSATARFGADSPLPPPGAVNDADDKKVVEEETARPMSCALVAGGTNGALCDPAARVIAGLLDYYQWAQYDAALNRLALMYCAM
ncbi:hypothetical protein ABL78_2282 [Leptomonas seymouri]|uniref:Uncharacterized protein n=1 Tax=Leptomonas seymouri TaxID=5684 RepID=A0A0N1I9F2_LEPSE|nr:hypothetical protein ABL78_2282 [Leptomonas seymouri]|eukprot:KPI88614.1 hypothetical protein ABL78_2282 [Leptomonas seymouri]